MVGTPWDVAGSGTVPPWGLELSLDLAADARNPTVAPSDLGGGDAMAGLTPAGPDWGT